MPDLPSGTVTLLFTDIEGSTQLLRELGDDYATTLAEHNDALRRAFAAHGGVEVDTQGDAFLAAFARASDAVAAALEARGALAGSPMRVRMALHTGEPQLTEGRYVGLDVIRGARLCAAAQGGQVLLSGATRALVDTEVRDLGEHRLKDLAEPLRVYQAGQDDFPPLRTLSRSNLPVPPTPLIGRERELVEAAALLRAHRLLTLTGPGGSGKTRLALELGARAAESFSGGVVWVPLQTLRDSELVVPTIARTVGARDGLVEHLGDRRMLLLLDNLEQLLGVAGKLGELLERLPNLKLLVTSREPLHLGAEQEYPVGPLREPEAVELFVDRATAVRPDFADEEVAAEICRRVDCLPLALELAAARAKALSAAELLRRLDRRLPILTGGPRDAPERQRTLRATIAWSHDLLEPDEQGLFARLAVFPGGCTLEAAEGVCDADLDTLAALVDKSLVRREGERYWMLETIREYALECLEASGESEQLRRRHAEYYVDLARSVESLIRSPQAAALLDRLERDYANLREALAWFSGAGSDRALRLAVWGLAARMHSIGDAALDRRNLVEAARLYREGLEIGLQLGDELQTAYCLGGLAAVAAQRGSRGHAARLWGSVSALERAAGARLHDAERARYERVLHDLERAPDTAPEFAEGEAMSLAEAVEYALANVD
jgi:predicted ATPase